MLVGDWDGDRRGKENTIKDSFGQFQKVTFELQAIQ